MFDFFVISVYERIMKLVSEPDSKSELSIKRMVNSLNTKLFVGTSAADYPYDTNY